VKKGDLLAVIDPRPYQAALDQTKATLAKDEAALADAQTNLARYAALVKEQVIAQQQYDTQKSQVGQIEGQIGADKAQIENAQLQLSYTHITAPIPGVVGLRLVDVGNTIHASDPNGLVVITQIEPIAVVFTLPEDTLASVMQRMKSGELDADAYTRDDQTKIATGKLVTINNQIDPTTGTDKLKAIFDNKDHTLWPNQFVNIRLLLEIKKNALTIPVAAVQRGAQGTFVYVVKPDSSVESRQVQTSTTEGGIATVDKGLSDGEMVVTDGQDKLQPGSKVAVQGAGGPRRQAANGQGSSGGGQQ
jgi:multidrug efflux system membrane fusion protein